MLKELFINLNILISFVFIVFVFSKHNTINHESSVRIRYISAVAGGMLGILLIIFAIHAGDVILVDLRFIAIILIALYAGVAPAIVCATIIAIFRLLYFGISISSLLGAIVTIAVAVGCGMISKLDLKEWKKWFLMFTYSIAIISMNITVALKGIPEFHAVILNFWIASVSAGFIMYFATQYIVESNTLLRSLKEQSTKDFLTGLNNTRQFNLLFNNLIHKVGKDIEKFSLIVIDIDHFKKVNDTYGHPAGDAVLKQLAVVLSSVCSSSDIISRVGGEEFSILLSNYNYIRASILAERIRKAVKKHKFLLPEGLEVSCTVSIGVATYPDVVTSADMLISKADQALYEAKKLGRNQVYCVGYNCQLLPYVDFF